jgi:hypothetical protein
MIYTIGDSFTYGDELPDRNNAWPFLLGKEFNVPVTNLGRGGSGNTRIVKRVIDAAYKDDAELIIIAWTGPGRIELFTHSPINVWPGAQPRISHPLDQDAVRLLTLSHTKGWDIWSYRKWIRDIILCQNLLENQNKKYLMMVTWHDWEPNETTQDLWDKVNLKYFLGHPSTSNTPYYETFCSWHGDCPRGPGGHPLELGHQRIADKINEHIRNFGWLS